MPGHRIGLLDSFRFIAITLVALYHYYSRWTIPHPDNLYPYSNRYSNVLFDNGYLGVQFFFILSGFVIAFSIESCKTIMEFIKKRFIRLFPALLLASVITYLLIPLLDTDNSLAVLHRSELAGFIPSLTFIEPYFYQRLFNVQWPYIDGAYWSLAVEVKFYLIYAILFFANRGNIFKSWVFFAIVVTVFWLVTFVFNNKPFIKDNDIFNLFSYIFITRYIVYFTLGILFFNLYKNRQFLKNRQNLWLTIVVMCVLLPAQYVTELRTVKFFIFSFLASMLMMVFIYKPRYLNFLSGRFLQKIGIISYAIYLVHENIGVALIEDIINYFDIQNFQFLVPVLVYGILILVSLFIYNYFEKPVSAYLKKLLLKKETRPKETFDVSIQECHETKSFSNNSA
jgi:peptidoglycan/LPS O-acetylase OafA/YrhL